MKNTNYNSRLSIILAASLSLLPACRFVVPTNKETSALSEKGNFNNGAPAWAKLPKDQRVNLPSNTGVIPQTFTVPESASFSAQASASTALGANVGRGIEMDTNSVTSIRRKVENKTPSLNSTEASSLAGTANNDSELAKLENQCPGTENAVEDAIKTEDVNSRIKKYLVLTKRCPKSSSIWTWLAKDYLLVGRANDARRCAQAAISIDPSNVEASAIANQLNSKN